MTDRTIEVTEKVKTNVEGVDVRVTISDFTTIREVVKVDNSWAAVNPFKMPDTSLVFSDKDEAIKAASNLAI